MWVLVNECLTLLSGQTGVKKASHEEACELIARKETMPIASICCATQPDHHTDKFSYT